MQTEQDDIDEIMDEFDFVRVKQTMDALNWKWGMDGVPYIGDMRRVVRNLFKAAREQGEHEASYIISTGGFHVTRTLFPGEPKRYYSLKFVVTEQKNYE
jgi:hypothetical protein